MKKKTGSRKNKNNLLPNVAYCVNFHDKCLHFITLPTVFDIIVLVFNIITCRFWLLDHYNSEMNIFLIKK